MERMIIKNDVLKQRYKDIETDRVNADKLSFSAIKVARKRPEKNVIRSAKNLIPPRPLKSMAGLQSSRSNRGYHFNESENGVGKTGHGGYRHHFDEKKSSKKKTGSAEERKVLHNVQYNKEGRGRRGLGYFYSHDIRYSNDEIERSGQLDSIDSEYHRVEWSGNDKVGQRGHDKIVRRNGNRTGFDFSRLSFDIKNGLDSQGRGSNEYGDHGIGRNNNKASGYEAWKSERKAIEEHLNIVHGTRGAWKKEYRNGKNIESEVSVYGKKCSNSIVDGIKISEFIHAIRTSEGDSLTQEFEQNPPEGQRRQHRRSRGQRDHGVRVKNRDAKLSTTGSSKELQLAPSNKRTPKQMPQKDHSDDDSSDAPGSDQCQSLENIPYEAPISWADYTKEFDGRSVLH